MVDDAAAARLTTEQTRPDHLVMVAIVGCGFRQSRWNSSGRGRISDGGRIAETI